MKPLTALRIGIVILLATTAGCHKMLASWWGSIDDDPTTTYQETQNVREEISRLAGMEHEWAEKNGGRRYYTFYRYFDFLATVDSIRVANGIYEGQAIVSGIQQMTWERRRWYRNTGRKDEIEEEFRKAQASFESREGPTWRKVNAKEHEALYQETMPLLLRWLLKTYFWWAFIFIFYFKIFWREKNENIARFGWFAAIVYAIFHPYVFLKCIERNSRKFGRWLWFEATVRRAGENLWTPLSDGVLREMRSFSEGSRSFREQRALFEASGVLPRHSFVPALLVTLVLLPSDLVQVCVGDVPEGMVTTQTISQEIICNNLSPPTEVASGVAHVGILVEEMTIFSPEDGGEYRTEYTFFIPEPLVLEIWKIPVVWLRTQTKRAFSHLQHGEYHEKVSYVFSSTLLFCDRFGYGSKLNSRDQALGSQ